MERGVWLITPGQNRIRGGDPRLADPGALGIALRQATFPAAPVPPPAEAAGDLRVEFDANVRVIDGASMRRAAVLALVALGIIAASGGTVIARAGIAVSASYAVDLRSQPPTKSKRVVHAPVRVTARAMYRRVVRSDGPNKV